MILSMNIEDNYKNPTFEFHINRESRDKYKIQDALFSISGEIIFSNFNASRELAHQINLERRSEDPVRAGELNAMGLLDEIMHYLIESYREKLNTQIFTRIEDHISRQL
ncbi:MAG: hypothetical protein P8X42_12795, partial [Calditrichaceae bacterium]